MAVKGAPRREYFPPERHFPEVKQANALNAYDGGNLNVLLDSPEVGLVTLTYEAGVNEWNLDDLGLEKSLVIPEATFRRAAQNYLK